MNLHIPKKLVSMVTFLYLMICLWLWIVPNSHYLNKMYFLQRPQANPEKSNGFLDEMLKTQYFEGGHKSKVYLDSEGKPTYGSGILVENKSYTKPEGAPDDWVPAKYRGMYLSEDDGWDLFEEKYEEKQKHVRYMYGEGFEDVPHEIKGLLYDLAYNLGAKKLFTEFDGFLSDIKKGDYKEAAKELKHVNPDKGNYKTSKWWNQIGGTNTETENLKRVDNRATYLYDLLMEHGE
jgi:GH24 family phage-related lysozyme (muramidase)